MTISTFMFGDNDHEFFFLRNFNLRSSTQIWDEALKIKMQAVPIS